MRVKRPKVVSTRVTADEYAALDALAGGQRIGTWAREQLLAISARRTTEEAVIGAEDVQKLIDRADHDRFRKARARLASTDTASAS